MKYYKTIFQIEVLSEEPYAGDNLHDITYDITDGHCSGVLKRTGEKELTGKEMAGALKEQGSEPEFFMLNEDGTEREEL